MNKIEIPRILVVGFGFMGQTHAANLLKTPNVKLVGIVDVENPVDRIRSRGGNIATAQFDEEQLQGVAWYRNLDEALEILKPDAAVVALPTALHRESSEQCLKAGCHVLCEKPFAVTVEECTSVCECAEQYDKILSIGYVIRFASEHKYLYDTVKSGRLGPLEYLATTRFTGCPSWGFWKGNSGYDKHGGTLFDILCHDLDFTRHLFGEPQTITGCVCGAEQVAVLGYDGFKVKCEAGFVNPPSFPFQQGYMACFEKGSIVSARMGSCIEYREGAAEEHTFTEDPYMNEINAFVTALRTGEASKLCLGRDALETTRCCVELSRQAKAEAVNNGPSWDLHKKSV